jgi:RHS repeat-associated protein
LVNSGWQHPSFTGTYNDDNRLASVNGQTVTHDADGNMTLGPIRQDSGNVSLTYNSRNQLTSADGLSYSYDAEGVRRTITNASGTTRDVTDPNSAMSRLLIRHHPDGSKTYYVYGLGLLYEVNQAEQTKTYHYDQVGSTIARTDDTGKVIGSAEYSAYGITFWKQGDMDTPFLYNGQWGIQTDANGLLNMRARYYSPYLMRFLNADPIGFSGGSNWFAFADGNPISNSDPFGLWSWNQTWGVVKAVGGVAEVAVGLTVGAATSWTGVGAVAGGVVALHGIDTIQAGFRQAISGDEIDTGTSMAMQGAGLSRNTANMVDAGIGLASGAAGLASGASKTAAMMRASEASGLSLRQALSLYDEGAQALNNADFVALSKIASTPLQRGQEIRNGFVLTTTATQRLTQSLKLANTGLTPSGDLLMGATSFGSGVGRAFK